MRSALVHLGLMLALLGTACGPGRVASTRAETDTSGGDGDGDDEDSSSSSSESTPGDSTETESSETDSSDSVTFVPPTEGWGESCQCDPFAQDCPEGEKCVPFAGSGESWDCVKCVPIFGDQPAGEPCTSAGPVEATDDCDADSFCWNFHEADGEWVGGTCRPFCTGTADNPMCPAQSYCMIAGQGSIVLCVPYCDPLAQDCAPGEACTWALPAFTCSYTTENVPPGEPCSNGQCGPGLFCMGPELFPDCAGDSCCTPYCDLMLGDAACVALPGSSCVPFFEMGTEPQGYENVGVCLLP